MKAHNPQTIGKFLIGQKPIKFFRLIDVNGNTVLAYNTHLTQKAKHIQELNDMLQSDVIGDGVYFLQWKSTMRSEPQTITIHKGKVTTEPPLVPTPPKSLSDSVRSFDEALTDKTKIKQLELENESLKQQLAAMMEADDVTEINEAPDTTNVVLSLLKEVGLPLLDKYFELKEQEVAALSAARPSAQTPVYSPTPSPSGSMTKPVPVQKPPIVPSQNQPQPPPAVQIVTGGGQAFPEQPSGSSGSDDTDEQQLVLFIQEATPEELRDWYMNVKNTEDRFTVNMVKQYIDTYRDDAGYITQ